MLKYLLSAERTINFPTKFGKLVVFFFLFMKSLRSVCRDHYEAVRLQSRKIIQCKEILKMLISF